MTQQGLHRLIYASRRPQGLSRDPEAEVRDILIGSIKNNRADAVTGLLVATSQWFLQGLEGPPEAVRRTYDRICTDSRHFDTVIRVSLSVETRLFPRWTMCAPSMSDADATIHGQLVERASFDPYDAEPQAAVALLSHMAQLHDELLTYQHAELMGEVLRAA